MIFNAIVISLRSSQIQSLKLMISRMHLDLPSFTLHQWSGQSLKKKLSRREPQFNYLNEVTEPFFEQRKAAFRFSNE